MIGYTVNAKVKRFIKERRKEKTLITRDFLNALDAEVERVVTQSVEQSDDDYITQLAVTVPKKTTSDRLICDVRIKERARSTKSDAVVSKKFLADLNSYVAAVIITSMDLIVGAYMKQLAAGNAASTVADKKPDHTPEPTIKKSDTPRKDVKFEAALPCEHVLVTYTLCVQQAVLTCTMRIFTAKTTDRIEKAVAQMARRALTSIGVHDESTITIDSIERQKGKA